FVSRVDLAAGDVLPPIGVRRRFSTAERAGDGLHGVARVVLLVAVDVEAARAELTARHEDGFGLVELEHVAECVNRGDALGVAVAELVDRAVIVAGQFAFELVEQFARVRHSGYSMGLSASGASRSGSRAVARSTFRNSAGASHGCGHPDVRSTCPFPGCSIRWHGRPVADTAGHCPGIRTVVPR